MNSLFGPKKPKGPAVGDVLDSLNSPGKRGNLLLIWSVKRWKERLAIERAEDRMQLTTEQQEDAAAEAERRAKELADKLKNSPRKAPTGANSAADEAPLPAEEKFEGGRPPPATVKQGGSAVTVNVGSRDGACG